MTTDSLRAGRVETVAAASGHRFSKALKPEIVLIAGLGVEGDAHAGRLVRHRSRVKADPSQPNLRQIHLIHGELFDALADQGFRVGPGDLGENVVTRGLDLLGLPVGARLLLGDEAEIEVTGLRNPCGQIEAFQAGLLAAVLDRAEDGRLVRKAGIMGIVLRGGRVRPGDPVAVRLPAPPHRPLDRV